LAASLIRPGSSEVGGLIGGLIGLGVVGLFSLVIIGLFFGQLSIAHAALLASAPLLSWLAEMPVVRRRGFFAHASARLILPSLFVAAALTGARQQFVADSVRTTSGGTNEPSAEDYLNFGK
jgi:predicted lipid-binding transport protein (Tim44 family)